jgi:hypothetical protein
MSSSATAITPIYWEPAGRNFSRIVPLLSHSLSTTVSINTSEKQLRPATTIALPSASATLFRATLIPSKILRIEIC